MINDRQVARTMVEYGGSFVSPLGAAALAADSSNLKKIQDAFPEYWEHYRRMAQQISEFDNAKIKRLEREVELFREYSDYGDVGVVDSILRGEEMARKEAKP